ncbi:hypothetical protein H6G81_02500 [Scytonema hofmannii FACHB-248]|uniref:Uncharacterized protein n=1 Tax=Scytonema hofmannii FACHB-248 TaxID=1842502 RepID=A0ABR8GK53_9CYAN|nr:MULTISPECIES: hypothetical protein [Nostocales]MBD2603429.1 hypothetical protein [Scytonema hofmannii FACHB-248]
MPSLSETLLRTAGFYLCFFVSRTRSKDAKEEESDRVLVGEWRSHLRGN